MEEETHLLAGARVGTTSMVAFSLSSMGVAAAIASSAVLGVLVGLVLTALWRVTAAHL